MTAPLSAPKPMTPIERNAAIKARQSAARAILKIDGEDVRNLTLGRCRSLLKTRRTESYALSVIVGRLKHLPDDTIVGSLLNDDEISSIAKQGREYGNAA